MAFRNLSTSSIFTGVKTSKLWDQTTFPGTFESIQTVYLSSAQSTISFTNIPQTYSHLQIRFFSRNTTAANSTSVSRMIFNSDTAANYTRHYLFGTGSSVVSGNGSNVNDIDIGITPNGSTLTNTFGVHIVDILDYTSLNKFKTVKSLNGYSQNNNGEEEVWYSSGAWRKSPIEAVTSITITSGGTTFASNTHCALYGIRSA